MRKSIALLLTLCLFTLAATGCVLSAPGNSTSGSKSSIPDDPIVFQGLTAVDNDECVIKITGIDANGFWGYTLNVTLENKSADKTYMFAVQSAAIDGVQCDPFFASEVAPGKKAVEKITFNDNTLNEIGLKCTDFELTFRVHDSNDWTADEVALETVHVYPYGEEKAETFVRKPQDADNVIIDNEYVTVTVIGYEKDNIWGYGVKLFLQNKTDVEVMFGIDEASVNGYMIDPFWANSVISGKCAYSTVHWSDTALAENGITSIEDIEFVLRARNSEELTADYFAKETISLHP